VIRGVVAIVLAALGMYVAQVTPSQAAASQAESAPPVASAPAPVQPLPFSHKIHAGNVKLPCETCHELSKSGQSLTIPQAPFCMQCHQGIATDKPGVQQLAAFSKTGQLIPWVRVYEVPSFVTFSHKWHLDHGNTCQECHGDVAERDQLFRETDISMAGCLGCHTAKKANSSCDTCHMLDQAGIREIWGQGKIGANAYFSRSQGNSRLRDFIQESYISLIDPDYSAISRLAQTGYNAKGTTFAGN
jgi:hypothetical protein